MDYFPTPPPSSPFPTSGSKQNFSPFSQLPPSNNKTPQSPTARVQSPPMDVLVEEEGEEEAEFQPQLEQQQLEAKMEELERKIEHGGIQLELNGIGVGMQMDSEKLGFVNDEEQQQQAIVEEQTLRLFQLCDCDSKGFIVRSDLDRLETLVSVAQFAVLEKAFAQADRYRVNLVYEKDFLAVIKPILLGQTSKEQQRHILLHNRSMENGVAEFRTISLDHDGEQRKNSSDEWSPTQKLTIAINSSLNSDTGGGLATVRSEHELPTMGYLGGLSPGSQPSEYWQSSVGRRTGSHSPSTHSGISLHDEMLLLTTSNGHQNQLQLQHLSAHHDRANGLSAHVHLRELSSPGSTCSEPLPVHEADMIQKYLNRRSTCANSTMVSDQFLDLDARCPERIFKVVFVGDSAVGKTCFLHRFCHNRFKPLFSATIGVDFTVKTLNVRDRLVALQLWDTAGQERFRSITKQYFRKADGVVLMYDVTSETSFINVRNWIESVRVGVDDGCVLCLVGNKVDLYPNEHCRTITYQHGKDLAEEFDMLFFETSAFTGQGIEDAMQALALRLQQREDEHMEELIKLESMLAGGKRSWCCI